MMKNGYTLHSYGSKLEILFDGTTYIVLTVEDTRDPDHGLEMVINMDDFREYLKTMIAQLGIDNSKVS
jgi:hypothetical protein